MWSSKWTERNMEQFPSLDKQKSEKNTQKNVLAWSRVQNLLNSSQECSQDKKKSVCVWGGWLRHLYDAIDVESFEIPGKLIFVLISKKQGTYVRIKECWKTETEVIARRNAMSPPSVSMVPFPNNQSRSSSKDKPHRNSQSDWLSNHCLYQMLVLLQIHLNLIYSCQTTHNNEKDTDFHL